MKWLPTRQTGRVMLFKTDDKDIAMRTSAHIAWHPINPILGGFRLILRDRSAAHWFTEMASAPNAEASCDHQARNQSFRSMT